MLARMGSAVGEAREVRGGICSVSGEEFGTGLIVGSPCVFQFPVVGYLCVYLLVGTSGGQRLCWDVFHRFSAFFC